MSVFSRIDFQKVKTLFFQDFPKPLHILNVITFRNKEDYKWYGFFVKPLVKLVGGSLVFTAKFNKSYSGKKLADEIFIVEYPSQKNFFLLALNPYYMLINDFREKGVKYFEASWTHAKDFKNYNDLKNYKYYFIIHFNSLNFQESLSYIRNIFSSCCLSLVYSSNETTYFSFLKAFKANDPNPLSFKSTMIFGVNSEDECDRAIKELNLIERLNQVQSFNLGLYEREIDFAPDFKNGIPLRAVLIIFLLLFLIALFFILLFSIIF